jgi:predicted heme/steroid binding protein
MRLLARLPRLVATASLAVAVGAVGATVFTAIEKPVAAHASTPGGSITRSEVLSRAQTWVDRGIFYTSGAYTNGPDGGSYQEDCSGYMSMALHLSTSMDTVSLPSVLTQITKDQLKPGDLLGVIGPGTGGAAGHVLMFAGWADTGHTKYNAYENSGGRYVHYSGGANAIPYPYWSPNPGTYLPYRYNHIVDDGAGGTQIYEAASDRSWGSLPVSGVSGAVTGSSVAALNSGGVKLVYTIVNGGVYEASAALSWQNLPTGIGQVTGSALAALDVGGTKFIYTIKNGSVYEASSANGWQNLPTGITGVSESALAVVNVGATKFVYTVVNGVVYEASSANSWLNLSTGINGVSASALAAINVSGTKFVYTIKNGGLFEASSANAWQNLATGNTGLSGSALAALNVGGTKLVYTVINNAIYEASSANSWGNLPTSVAGTTVAAVAVGGVKNIYTR